MWVVNSGERHGEGIGLTGWLSLQEDGEICLNSMQCKSGCCQHDTILGVARCTHKAMENSECSPKVCALEAWGWSGGGDLSMHC